MYYLDKLKAQIEEARKSLTDTVTRVDSPEFAEEMKRYGAKPGESLYPERCGTLRSAMNHAVSPTLAHAVWLQEQAAAEVVYLERLQKVAEALGIDEESLPWLELMTTAPATASKYHRLRYHSEMDDLKEAVHKAANEVKEDANDREREEAIAALESAGFVENEDDGEIYERGNERAHIEWDRKHSVYTFTLEVNGAETVFGKSGEFAKLLEAVGCHAHAEQEANK